MRFYFEFLSHDEEITDFEGVELADWLTAHHHAVQIVKRTVPFLPEGSEWRGLRIQVRDECRRHVLSVLFPAATRYAALLTQTSLQTNYLPVVFGRRSGPAAHSSSPAPGVGLAGGEGKAAPPIYGTH
jgi:hypothetical protein